MRETAGFLEHIFIEPGLPDRGAFTLKGDAFFHLARVKRARRGEEVTWSDGKSSAGRAVVEEVGEGEIRLRVLEEWEIRRERPRIVLYQALTKSGKMDDILRRCTEVGVDCYHPFIASRSLPGLEKAAAEERMERWKKVIREASRQSRRDFIPELKRPVRWDDCLSSLGEQEFCLLAWEGEKERRLLEALPSGIPESVALVVGPEGGFSIAEAGELVAAGAVAVTLGKNVLRTENAGMVMAVLVGGHYGRI